MLVALLMWTFVACGVAIIAACVVWLAALALKQWFDDRAGL